MQWGIWRMNEFTKEDLKELLYALDCCHNTPTGVKSPPLMIKIQSILDSYCAKENNCDHDWGVGFGSIHSPIIYCKKCWCQKPLVPHNTFNKMMGLNK
jgi:hypothetical protein